MNGLHDDKKNIKKVTPVYPRTVKLKNGVRVLRTGLRGPS